MRIETPITVDFETFAIEDRPDYPPEPVGVSIILPSKRPKYYAWGHPTENNCTKAQAAKVLKQVWRDKHPKLFHNGKYDMDVGEVHLGLRKLSYHEFHDTMFLAFLDNPHNDKLGLKPLSEIYLDLPPEEQDELHNWIRDNLRLSDKGGKGEISHIRDNVPWKTYKIPPTKTGAFIAYTPGKLAGRYANGDTYRTLNLYKLWARSVLQDRNMVEAYDRERKLVPIFLKQEREGIKIAERRLRKSTKQWEKSLEFSENWIRKKLKTPDLDLDKGDELADALEDAGVVEEWILTPGGERSTSKDNLKEVILDKQILSVLEFRSSLTNTLRNFGRKWLGVAERSNGFIYTNWNQVRQSKGVGGKTKGTRTGRLSTNPNFQNMPKKPKIQVYNKSGVAKAKKMDSDFILLPKAFMKHLLPDIRDFIVPDKKGHVLLNRDYSQQELRILGHFEDNVLLNAYRENPRMDIHVYAQKLINRMLNANFPKKPIKNMGFGLIYGMGLDLLASTMGVDKHTAKKIKNAYLSIFPGLGDLDDDLKFIGRNNESIRTWGGREYFVEPPRMVKGHLRTWEYKLLNILIQGSAADCTKQAIINYDAIKKEGRFILTVHDELMTDVNKKAAKKEMSILREAMTDVDFDVPMLSDGQWSDYSWAKLKTFKEAA